MPVLTHANDIALAENVMYGVKMEKDNVEMIPSPMNHSHGLRRYYANMYNGSSVVLLGSVMDILRFYKNIDTYSAGLSALVALSSQPVQCIPRRMGPKKSVFHTNEKIFFNEFLPIK